jgi:hypothetical protein
VCHSCISSRAFSATEKAYATNFREVLQFQHIFTVTNSEVGLGVSDPRPTRFLGTELAPASPQSAGPGTSKAASGSCR